MKRNKIIDICSKWVEKDKRRVAVVFLSEPDDEDGQMTQSNIVSGKMDKIVDLLGSELCNNKVFTLIINRASEAALRMRIRKVNEQYEEE